MASTPGGSLVDGAAGSNTASGNAVTAHHLMSRQLSSLPAVRRSGRSTSNPYRGHPPTRLGTEASGSHDKKRKAPTEEAPCGISEAAKASDSAPLTPIDPNRTYSSKDGAKGRSSEHAMVGNTWSSPTKRKCLSTRSYLSLFKPHRKGEATAVAVRSEQSSIPTKTNKVKECPFQKLQRLPDGCHPDFDNDHLYSVNMLREFWHKSRGAVFVDDKNNLVEYKSLLAFLNSEQEGDGAYIDADALAMLRARFARHIAYERKAGSSNFLEYWVPAYLSKGQLETYSSILLENSSTLLSQMPTDNFGPLRDIVMRLWKCCNHPCLVGLRHSPVNTSDVTESEDNRMHNSGKLLLLEKMLKEIRNKRLRAIVLFQSDGAVGDRLGNILEELVRHRFGPESCERVQNRSAFLVKQEAMNMFNDTTKGRFVFLIDSRACHSSINLSSVDTIIIYGSDLNPLNDLKALRKIKIESQLKYVRIFRLYTPFTVEEKGLVLAKQSMTIDSNGQDIMPSLSHCLLSWGVSFLFSRVGELQQDNCASKSYESGTVFMDKVVLEFLTELSTDIEDSGKVNSSTISKACMSGEFYSRNITLIGERDGISSLDGDPPKFWLNLLDGKSRRPTEETNEARRKLRKTGEIAGSCSKFSSDVMNDDLFPEISTPSSVELHLLPEIGVENVSTPKSLHAELKRELSKLIKVLKLPDDVHNVAKQLLEYLLKNHLVVREPQDIQHAFNIALCWCAASLRHYTKLDHQESLALAAGCLNYEYNKELTGYFYKKIEKKFLHKSGRKRKKIPNYRLLPHESSSANLRSDHNFPKQAVDLHGNFTNGTQESQCTANQMVSDGQELVPAPEADRECHLSSEEPHISPKQAVDHHGNFTNGTQESQSATDQMVSDGQELVSAPETEIECHLSSEELHMFPRQAVDLHGDFINGTQESRSAADQMVSDGQELVSALQDDIECHLSSEEPHVFPKKAMDLRGNFTNGTQESQSAADQMVSDEQELVSAPEAEIECHLSSEEPHTFPKQAVDLHGDFINGTQESRSAADQMVSDGQELVSAPEAGIECHLSSEEPHVLPKQAVDLHGNFTNGTQESKSAADQMVSDGQGLVSSPEADREHHLSSEEPPGRTAMKRIDLFNHIFSLREKNIMEKQQHELLNLRTQRNTEVRKLREVCHAVVQHIRISDIDEEIRSNQIKLVIKWFTLLMFTFLVHMKHQLAKLDALQSTTQAKERLMKEKLKQEILSGRLDQFLDLCSTLPDSNFVVEEFIHFKKQNGDNHVDNTLALGCDQFLGDRLVGITLARNPVPSEAFSACAVRNEPTEAHMRSGGGAASESVDLPDCNIHCSSDGTDSCSASHDSINQESLTGGSRSTKHAKRNNIANPSMLPGSVASLVMGVNADNDITVAADPDCLELPVSACPQNLMTLQNQPAEAEPTDTLIAMATQDLQTEMQTSCPTVNAQHQRICPDDSSKMNLDPDATAEMLQEGTTSDHLGDCSTGFKDKNVDTVAADPLSSENQSYIAPQNPAVLPDAWEVGTQIDQSSMPAQHSTSLPAEQNTAISGHPPAEAEPSNLDMEADRGLQPDIRSPDVLPVSLAIGTHANQLSTYSLQSSDAPSMPPPAFAESPGMLGTQVEQDLHPDMAPSTSLLSVPLQTMFLDDRNQIGCRPDRATGLSEEGETENLSCATSNLATLPASRESETENGQASVPAHETRSPHVQHSLATSQLPTDDVQPPTSILSEEAERSGMLCATAAQDLQHGMQPSITTQDARLERTDLSGMPVTRSTAILQTVEPSWDPHAEQAGTLGMLSDPDLRPEVQPSSPMEDQPAEAEGADTLGIIAAQNLQPETQSSISVQYNPPERTHPDERIQIGLQPSLTSGPEQPTHLFTVPPAAVNNLSHSSEPLIIEYERLKLCKAALNKGFEQKKSKIQAECNQEIEKVMKKYELLYQKEEQAYHHSDKCLDDMYMKVFLQQSLGENFRERFMKSAQERSASPTIWQAPQSFQQTLPRISVAQTTSLPVASPLGTRPPGLNTLHSAGPLQPSQAAHPSASEAVQPQSLYRSTPSPVSSMPLRNGGYRRAPAPHLQHLRMPAASAIARRDQQQLAAMSPGIASSSRQSAPGMLGSFASPASALAGVPLMSMASSSVQQAMASSSVQQAMPSSSNSLAALPASSLLPGSGAELMGSYVQSPSTIPVAMAVQQASSLTPGSGPELMGSYVQSPSTIPVAMAAPGFHHVLGGGPLNGAAGIQQTGVHLAGINQAAPEPTREAQALQLFQWQWPHAMAPPSLLQQILASSSNPHPGFAVSSTNRYLMAAQQAFIPNPALGNMAGTLNAASGVWQHGGALPAAASQHAPGPASSSVQPAARTGQQTGGAPGVAVAQGDAGGEVVCLSDDEE
ncbi:unnamed protein product [Urochloa decumbens]|uniref:Helicase C-terminal domain-containing protein n=1 Tax=Urochloa decumbens TaxID=240449 RepID=A0ABC9GXN7_9POAL